MVVSPAVAESIDNHKASLKAWAETHRKSTDADDSESELTPLDNAPEGSEADEIGDVDGGKNELDAEEEDEEEEEEEADEEEREVPVQQRKKVQAIVIEDVDDEIEVVEPVVHRKKRRVENIDAEEDEVEDDEEVEDEEEEVHAHRNKKRHVIHLLRRDEEEPENHGAVFCCNVEGTVAEGNKAKAHPATTHFRRSVISVSWFTKNVYIFEDSVLVDTVFNPQSPEYFDVAYTDSGTIFDPFASSPLVNSPVTSTSPLVNSPVTSMYEKPGSISSKQRRQVPTSVAEVVAKAKGRTGTQDKFISQVKEVGIRFSYLTQDREPPMTKTLAAATLSKEFPNFGNTVEIFRAYVGVFFADLEFQRWPWKQNWSKSWGKQMGDQKQSCQHQE
ncbi:hypothetical protein BDR26DRAFT_872291 [Obelidium mucronatum]|nr:hypothetical protein BDR26DRAFT_872291 [Obelidium mucronatum]